MHRERHFHPHFHFPWPLRSRERRDHGFESRRSPEKPFFLAIRNLLNCESLRWSHTHFICISAVHISSFKKGFV